ncbi:MAG: amidohydrolase family protein [Anaerolineaceae bacterium]|nr:amidohydrolase family protein [Anaerolineaceae bacterium]
MIVDCHTHLWGRPQDVALATDSSGEPTVHLAADCSDHMDAMGPVDLALVLGFASRHLGAEVSIDFLGQHVGLRGKHQVGIVGIDPADETWPERLAEAVDEWGFRGVTVCPPCQDVHPTDSRALELFAVCQQRKLPVIVDCPAQWRAPAVMAYARPDLLDGVARELPDLKLLVTALGYPYLDETLVLLEKFPNVYADTAHLASRPLALSRALSRANEAGLIDKVLFGSGFPFARPRQAMAMLYHQCAPQRVPAEYLLPREVIERLVHRDALSLLGIPRPEGFVERHAGPERVDEDQQSAEKSVDKR